MTVPCAPVEARDEDQRAIDSNHPDDVSQNVLPAPLPESLFQILGVAVVDQIGEILIVKTVVSVRDKQFLGSNQTQAVEEFRADRIGTPLPAVKSQMRCAHALPATEIGQHPPLLVVGMSRGVEGACCRLKAEQALP